MQEEDRAPSSVGSINLHDSHEADHLGCWSPRTAGHHRLALPSLHTAGPCHLDSVPTREHDFCHSFPRQLLSHFPVSNSYAAKSGLSPRKCPPEVLCHVLSHPQAVMTRGGVQAAGKEVLNLKR